MLNLHPEWQPNFYVNQNKQLIKAIETDYASAHSHVQAALSVKNVADSWKMRRFTENVKPRVQIAKVDVREEREARERATLETQSMIAGKEFIR
jgi:hypothetical protein